MRRISLMLFFLLSSCTSVEVIPLEGFGHSKLNGESQVRVYQRADTIGRGFLEIALMRIPESKATKSQALEMFKKRAQSLGANAVLLVGKTDENAPKAFGLQKKAMEAGFHKATAIFFTEPR